MDLWLRVLSLMVLLVLDDRGVLDEYRITVSRVGNYQGACKLGQNKESRQVVFFDEGRKRVGKGCLPEQV